MKTRKWLLPITALAAATAFMTGCSITSNDINLDVTVDSDLKATATVTISNIDRAQFTNGDNNLSKLVIYYAYDSDKKANLAKIAGHNPTDDYYYFSQDEYDGYVKYEVPSEVVAAFKNSTDTTWEYTFDSIQLPAVAAEQEGDFLVYLEGMDSGFGGSHSGHSTSQIFTVQPPEISTKTDISGATVTVDTANKNVSVSFDGTPVTSGYNVEYIKQGETTGTSTFPTEGGKYTAKITPAEGSDYEGEKTVDFVVDKLIEGTHKITTTKNDKPYTRVIFVVPKADLAGSKSITFSVTKGGVTKTATSTKYYSGSLLDDVTYKAASSDLVLLCVSVSGAGTDDFECSYALNK